MIAYPTFRRKGKLSQSTTALPPWPFRLLELLLSLLLLLITLLLLLPWSRAPVATTCIEEEDDDGIVWALLRERNTLPIS